MDHQAPLNGGPRVQIHSPLAEGVVGNLAEFASDCTTLAELQVRLAVNDLKESVSQAARPLAGLVTGAALLLACLPVALLGLGELLASGAGLSRGAALLVVAGTAAVVAGLLFWSCASRFGASFQSFARSREELERNLAWLKTVLAHSGRPPVHHRRR